MKNNHEIEKVCAYCEYSRDTNDKEYVICTKKGVVHVMGRCRKFIYDPMKRMPKRTPSTEGKLEYVDLNSEN